MLAVVVNNEPLHDPSPSKIILTPLLVSFLALPLLIAATTSTSTDNLHGAVWSPITLAAHPGVKKTYAAS